MITHALAEELLEIFELKAVCYQKFYLNYTVEEKINFSLFHSVKKNCSYVQIIRFYFLIIIY